MDIVNITTEFIKLDSLLKYAGVVSSGSDAKLLISQKRVLVNNETETKRGRKIVPGDVVEIVGVSTFKVE